jgi:sec-independent protein translocase protein TatA
MLLGLGGPEILVVLIIVLVLFGPKNLPKLGSALGKTVKNVREGMEGEDEEDESKSIEKSDDSE